WTRGACLQHLVQIGRSYRFWSARVAGVYLLSRLTKSPLIERWGRLRPELVPGFCRKRKLLLPAGRHKPEPSAPTVGSASWDPCSFLISGKVPARNGPSHFPGGDTHAMVPATSAVVRRRRMKD